jgi:hypothetical protein
VAGLAQVVWGVRGGLGHFLPTDVQRATSLLSRAWNDLTAVWIWLLETPTMGQLPLYQLYQRRLMVPTGHWTGPLRLRVEPTQATTMMCVGEPIATSSPCLMATPMMVLESMGRSMVLAPLEGVGRHAGLVCRGPAAGRSQGWVV